MYMIPSTVSNYEEILYLTFPMERTSTNVNEPQTLWKEPPIEDIDSRHQSEQDNIASLLSKLCIEAIIEAVLLFKIPELPTLAELSRSTQYFKANTHATCYCARYQARPTKNYLIGVKRIFRYLKYTIHIGLWYPKDTGFDLTAFSYSNHMGCLVRRKSTSGGIQFLGGNKLISWSSKKHDCTSMSIAEAEYVSISAYCAQVLWMRTQLTDYGFHFDKIPMYCDSKVAIAILCNLV
ncbi:hypothetical protein Tco_0090946 [Tanacetum coccineum]